MKKISVHFLIFLSLSIFALTLISCSGTKISKNTSSLKNSKYFRILADADDDPIFVKLQDDLGIDPKMERYTVVVDIRDANEQMRYVLIGDETNPARFGWNQLSDQVKQGLVNWTGSNKERLD